MFKLALLPAIPSLILSVILAPAGVLQDRDRAKLPSDFVLGIIPFPSSGAKPNKAKIKVFHSRASYISTVLGGSVLPLLSQSPGSNTAPPFPDIQLGAAGALLPEGIEAIIANDRDNTVIAVFTDDDALRELAKVVRALDVPVVPIHVLARAIVVVTDSAGKIGRIELRGDGIVAGERRIQLKTTANEDDSVRGMPAVFTSDTDIYARVMPTGLIDVSAEWYVDVAWKTAENRKPVRLRNVFRASRAGRNGEKVTITRSTLKIPTGTAELVLEVTPWAMWQRAKQ